jgi:hypothetical protein
MSEVIDAETGELVDETVTDLVPLAPAAFSFVDDPEEFLANATKQAKVLKSFLVKSKSVMKIGNGEHVKVGGWQFLAQQAGLSVGTSAAPITLNDGDTGWKAHAIVYRNGQIVGEADALCLRSERNWKGSDTYAICSMAQTRAISKAIRGVLGFVVVMAGYSDTPAEEMPREPRKRSSQKTELVGESFEDMFEPETADMATAASPSQKKKLDVVVSKLRAADRLHTEHLYLAVARMRDTDPDLWIEGAKNTADDGELHWGPLRDSLSKGEASNLIDRLTKLEAAA